MITRPSTSRILLDLVEELQKEILPLLPDSVSQIRLQMIMSVLGNCAVRAGTEIAIMSDEIALNSAYARDVVAATGNTVVAQALEDVAPDGDLHLEAVSTVYSRSGNALAVALEAAMDAGLDELIVRGEDLLRLRITNEQSVAESYAMAGR